MITDVNKAHNLKKTNSVQLIPDQNTTVLQCRNQTS